MRDEDGDLLVGEPDFPDYAPGTIVEITPLLCGLWEPWTAATLQFVRVVRRIEALGHELTDFERITLARAERSAAASIRLEAMALRRAFAFMRSNGPEGYSIGFKAHDVWYMPDSWWWDVGGIERW
jgi:hypothetical protein